MNSSRIPSLFFPIFFLFVLTGLYSPAQTVTNTVALQRSSQALNQQHTEMQRVVIAAARQKGWPLTIKHKNGRVSYLRQIDSRGFPVYVTTTDNIISAATIRTNQLWPGGSTGLALNGGSNPNMKGKIAIWDEGLVRPTHVELVGRVSQQDGNTTLSDHSTHVSGTMIAAGVNPVAKGMSFGAQQLLCYDFNNDESEMFAAAKNGLLISNHSYADIAGWNFNDAQNRWEWWGNPGDTVDVKFGLYDQDAQIWDSIAYNAPNYLIAKAGGNNPGETGPAVGQPYFRFNSNGIMASAGARPAGISNNAGYETIATYGDAKNILCLGAVNPIPGGYNSPSDVVLAGFSSQGPTGDGRIKPDLVADGVNVLSSISTSDNAYDIFSGTSMATPASAGSAFLLQEYWTKLHGATNFMRSATLRGLLIHSADEAGPAPGPDYQFGWGLIDMAKAASVITSDNSDRSQQIYQNNFTNGTHDRDTVTIIASGKMPLLATICWTDPPANGVNPPSSAHNFQDTVRKLVNDLDLRIVDSNTNKTFFPWVLNPFNRPAAATKGDNIRDNVERVELGDTAVPGHTYKIMVSHKGNLVRGSQAYSLLISGGGGVGYCADSSTSVTGTTITNLTLSNLNFTDPAPCTRSYEDLTAQGPARLAIGQTIPISVSYKTCGAATNTNIAVYIDLNNNGLFESNELVFNNTAAVLSSTGTAQAFTGSITVPGTVAAGTTTRMRVIAQDNASLAVPLPCGTYAAGETQDYAVTFINPSIDVGVTALEYPTVVSCASDSQIVSVRIHNFGSSDIVSGVPVATTITGGATTVTLTATCMDSIPKGGDVVFTYNNTFATKANTTYTFVSTTSLNTDLNTSNNSNTTGVTINAAEPAGTGAATICGTNATSVELTATTTGVDVPLWYDSPNATNPIAAGNNTTTNEITSNKTYYLGVNDLKTKGGVASKSVYENTGTTNYGAYFFGPGNFVSITTGVPLTIESARMYFSHSGQASFTLATLVSIDHVSGSYNYLPLYTTVVDVYATVKTPTVLSKTNPQLNVAVGDNTDTGGIFNLNIPVPTPGNYIIIIDTVTHGAGFFVNTNIPINPYPIKIPGIFSVTGNSFYDFGKPDSVAIEQKSYFPFYDLGIRLSGCPAATRTTVIATSEASPTISISGNILTSSAATGNQWYVSDSLLAGSTAQTDTAKFPGQYYTIVTDPTTGCTLQSNKITFTPASGGIGLTAAPNPSNGIFSLTFFVATADNTSITITSTLGQKVYEADYPGFSGLFSQQINVAYLASGMYVLKIFHGGNTYMEKLIIRH